MICGSANGIAVDGRRVEHATVDVGTLVEIGDVTLRVVESEQRRGDSSSSRRA